MADFFDKSVIQASGEKLNNSLEHHYASLIHDSEDAIIGKTLEGVVTSWNKAAETIFGYTATEMIGKNVTILFPSEKIEEEAYILSKIASGTKVDHFRTVRLKKDGERVEISVAISPIKDSHGNIIGASKIARALNSSLHIKNSPHRFIGQTEHYSAIVESSEDAIVSKTLDGTIVTWNPAAERMFGFQAHEIVGREMLLLFPEALVHEEEIILTKIAQGERIKHYATRRLTKNGRLIDVSVSISPIRNEFGVVIGASKIARDITEYITKENIIAGLLKEKNHFSSIVESSDDAIISKNLDGVVTSWNKSAEAIFGYSEPEMVGQAITKLIPKERLYEEMNILEKISLGKKIDHFQTIRLHRDGHEIDVSVTISPIHDANGNVIGASKIARDITEKVAAEQKLWEYANFDSLTNLPNRRLFQDRVNKAILKATRDFSHFALMYMDLNDFKQVNDKFGHECGDELLIIASKRISDCFRKSDTVARLGGDEFAALLPELSHKVDINKFKKAILKSLQKPFHIGNEKLYISVSIGVSLFPKNGITIQELIKFSDNEMYRDKAKSKTNLTGLS